MRLISRCGARLPCPLGRPTSETEAKADKFGCERLVELPALRSLKTRPADRIAIRLHVRAAPFPKAGLPGCSNVPGKQIATKVGVSPTTVSRCSQQRRLRRSERRARLEARTNPMESESYQPTRFLELSNFQPPTSRTTLLRYSVEGPRRKINARAKVFRQALAPARAGEEPDRWAIPCR
jgi:hypothetical protein